MPGNKWSRLQEATGSMGEALMRIAMLSDDRRYRADQLARMGRLDVMAQQRIDMDEQMLAQSFLRTQELTRAGGTRDARASADIVRERGTEGYTLNLGEGGTMAEALTGLGQGVPQQWDFDAETSETYLDREAANTQALGQARALGGVQTDILGTRADVMEGQGRLPTGSPLPQDRGGPESRAGMFEQGGRWFEDTPEGQAEGIAWLEELEAVKGGGDDLFKGMNLGELGVGGRPEDEGGNWFSKKFGGLFGGRGGGGAPADAGMMPQGAPADAGMMPQAGPTPEQMEQIQQLRDQGWTEEQIEEWLRTQG